MRNYIKWTGGKARLAEVISKHIPGDTVRLIDPFCGGNTLYHIIKPHEAILADANWRLIETHRAVQQSPMSLSNRLRQLEDFYNKADDKRAAYNTIRLKFNTNHNSYISLAAWFIYLNRLGYNGLYRENQSGDFNSPWGKRETAVLPSRKLLREYSEALRGVTFLSSDYKTTLGALNVQDGDLVVLDPPYFPTETSKAHNYNAGGFDDEDQRQLATIAAKMVASGAKVIAFNRDCPQARELWAGWEIISVSVSDAINQDGNGRGQRAEIIITQ